MHTQQAPSKGWGQVGQVWVWGWGWTLFIRSSRLSGPAENRRVSVRVADGPRHAHRKLLRCAANRPTLEPRSPASQQAEGHVPAVSTRCCCRLRKAFMGGR